LKIRWETAWELLALYLFYDLINLCLQELPKNDFFLIIDHYFSLISQRVFNELFSALRGKMQCRLENGCLHVTIFCLKRQYLALLLVNGHTMLNTPVLVRSLKLSNIGPG
jgi:hypothetical protein